MEKIWLKQYPKHIPHHIDIPHAHSLAELYMNACKLYTNKTAFSCLGKEISYAETLALSEQFARYLQNDLGLQKGDKIAIMLPNILQYPVVMFGALASLTVVNINPLDKGDTLKHILQDSEVNTIIVLENLTKNLYRVLPETSIKYYFN